jgi:capsular polysaccharide biosynthesis protein
MELRHYFGIVRRSWPIVAGLPLLVALLTIALSFVLPAQYTITAAMLVTQRPIAVNEPQVTMPDENNRESWAASEFIVDDILQVVETRRFADDIAAWIQAERGRSIKAKTINESIEAERTHRMIYITTSFRTPEEARFIVEGAIAMLQQRGLEYWGREESTTLEVSLLDLPEEAEPVKGVFGMLFDAGLRSMLALILGIGLAFLRHYLDQSLHRRDDVEALGLEVVGAIPVDSLPRPQP